MFLEYELQQSYKSKWSWSCHTLNSNLWPILVEQVVIDWDELAITFLKMTNPVCNYGLIKTSKQQIIASKRSPFS